MSEKSIQKAKTINGDMYQNCTIVKNNTINEIHELMTKGDVKGAMDLLDQQKNMIGTYHQYYPDYAIEIKTVFGRQIPCSKPLSKNAIEKLPPSIKGKFKIPSKYSAFKSLNELLNYSYRTQTYIDIDIIELKKMIGDFEDPYQEEISAITESSKRKLMIMPKKFPEAKPYRITLEETVESLDYILLRTTRIGAGNEIFISNSEQDTDIYIEIIINLQLNKQVLNLKLNNNGKKSKKTKLKYLKFMKEASEGKRVNITSLEDDIVMVSGLLGAINYSNGFENNDEEILFLENILEIEKKYERIIDIPEHIKRDDWKAISYLATGIRHAIFKGSWNYHFNEFELTEENIDLLKNIDDIPMELVLVTIPDVIIFGKKFKVSKLTRKLKSAIIDDIVKLRAKLEALEVGDIIKVKFVPSDNSEYEDIFDFEEDFIMIED